jgi:hypothetical protein
VIGAADVTFAALHSGTALAFNVAASQAVNISRRTFVRDCAAIAAATGLPLSFVERELEASQQVPAVTSPNDRPGIALVGCGTRIGRVNVA